jgi:hypothetical protein
MERRPRVADDFVAIRARMEELKRERELATHDEGEGDEWPDKSRWRVADAMRRSIGPRRYGPIQGY